MWRSKVSYTGLTVGKGQIQDWNSSNLAPESVFSAITCCCYTHTHACTHAHTHTHTHFIEHYLHYYVWYTCVFIFYFVFFNASWDSLRAPVQCIEVDSAPWNCTRQCRAPHTNGLASKVCKTLAQYLRALASESNIELTYTINLTMS